MGNGKVKKLGDITKRVIRKNKGNISNLPLTISAQYGLIHQEIFFNKTVASKNLEGYYLIENGEFAYNKSYSKGYPWGTIKRLDKYENGVLSSLYICFKVLKENDSEYIKQYFESSKWHKEISMIAVEGARNHGLLNISVSDFFDTAHQIPSLQEQEKIASFLSLIDDKINLQSEKVKYLKDYKKGLMQKIFSRKLRFKDENGNDYPEWEITTIEKIAKLEKGFTPNTNNEENWKGDILWLSIADMKQGKYISYVSKSISREALGNKKLIPKGTLIMSFKLTLGRLAIIDVPMVTNEAICHFYWKNNNISTEYMYYYLNTVNIKSFGSRATKGITLNNDSLNSIRIYLPIFDEQIKIATVLSSLDKKIEKEEEKLDSLNEYKKGLLQQMFV